MEKKSFTITALLLNIVVVVFELISLTICWGNQGLQMFQFYTEDSNMLALVACAAMAICQLRAMFSGTAVAIQAKQLKYISVCCLTLTFVVVILILAPMNGGIRGYKWMLFSGSMLYQHLLCPVIAFVSYVFFEKKPALNKKAMIFALVPTVIYATVAVSLNAVGTMNGPYPFLRVHDQPIYLSVIWCTLILGAAFLIAWLVWSFSNATKHQAVQN